MWNRKATANEDNVWIFSEGNQRWKTQERSSFEGRRKRKRVLFGKIMFAMFEGDPGTGVIAGNGSKGVREVKICTLVHT